MAKPKNTFKYPKTLDEKFFTSYKSFLSFDDLKVKLLDTSMEYDFAHIPSALSMLRYMSIMIPLMIYKYPEYKWVAGKQFGKQTYYTIYKALENSGLTGFTNLIPNDKEVTRPLLLNNINKEFAYVEETLGNSLGVAIGMALSQTRPIWINLSDSVFQMGRVQEALRVISQYNLNIFITIDGNRSTRCIGNDIEAHKYYGGQQPAEFVTNLFNANKIHINRVPAYSNYCNETILDAIEYLASDLPGPRAIYFDTVKGDGFLELQNNSVDWHYKKLTQNDYNRLIKTKDLK